MKKQGRMYVESNPQKRGGVGGRFSHRKLSHVTGEGDRKKENGHNAKHDVDTNALQVHRIMCTMII